MTTGEHRPQPFPRDPSSGGPGSPGTDPGRRRGLRPRSFAPLVVAAWAIGEIWLFLLLADLIGGLGVLTVIAAGFLLGALAIKRAGRRAWRNLAASLQPEGPPVEAPTRGGGNALAMLGGLLLMVPGLLSDLAGLLCLFPPTASLLRRLSGRLAGRAG
ncbi:FxsA family protein, partial [Streptomyces sparsus]